MGVDLHQNSIWDRMLLGWLSLGLVHQRDAIKANSCA